MRSNRRRAIASDPVSASLGTACIVAVGMLCVTQLDRAIRPVVAPPDSSAEIQVVSNNPDGVVLEVITGRVRRSPATAPNHGYDRVTIPGAGPNRRVGAPCVPVLGALIAAPTGAEVVVEVLETDAGAVYRDVMLEPVALPVAEEREDGLLRPALRFDLDSELYARDADYPPAAAELGGKARLREQEVVLLRIYPLRYNPVRHTLRHHARMRLAVRFTWPRGAREAPPSRPSSPVFDRLLQRLLINPPTDPVSPPLITPARDRGEAEESQGRGTGDTLGSRARSRLEIGVEADGFYRVSGSELEAAGLDLGSVDPQRLRLLEAGREIAIRVVGEADGVFDPGDTVEFFGRAMKTRYTRRNVYWLEQGDANGRRMSEREVTPSGAARVLTTHRTTVHAEEGNAEYWQAMPNGEGRDHYFWWRLASPSTTPFTIALPHLTPGTDATATLQVALHGRTDPIQDPDHHTRVIVNSRRVDDQLWNGQVPFRHSVSFPQSLLRNGDNTVAVELVADTGAVVDSLYLNFFEIDYTAGLAAIDGALRFTGDRNGAIEYRLRGFSGAAVELYDVTDPVAVVCLTSVRGPAASRELAFEDDSATPREYFAVTPAAKRSPASIELDQTSSLRSSAANGADYLVISHPDFLASMTPLLELRAAQGLRTLAVDVTDVYDEFSFGVFDPTAIRDFIRYAYESWQPPAPTFVVLVGDANQDYLDHLGTGTPDFVPTHLFETRFHGEFPEDNFYAAVSGDDILPDVLIGRIPVRTAAAAEAVVAKIVDYEAAAFGSGWNRNLLLMADGEPGGFAAAQDALARVHLSPPLTASRVFVDDFPGIAQARQALFAELEQGAVVASYLGHGSVGSWSRKQLLVSADVSSLKNRGKLPFVASLDCIDGYYPHPSIPFSLAETLLNADGIGAVAVWSPTGVGFLSEYTSIGEELFDRLFQEGEIRIGAATVDAVTTAFMNAQASSDNLRGLVLFGDPATRLALDRDGDGVLDRDAEDALRRRGSE